MGKVDWKTIKSEYITTETSYRKLAQKYGVHFKAVSQKGKSEGWVELRKAYKVKTITKAIEKSAERDSDRLAALMDTTTKAIGVAVKAFEDEQQFNRYLVERREKYAFPTRADEVEDIDEVSLLSERQWTEEKIFSKVDTKALKDLTAVLKDLTGLMRDFYNIPTPAQAEAQRIASERLEMDKRKNAVGDDEEDETGVIILPPTLSAEGGVDDE